MGNLRERSYLGWLDEEIEADKGRKVLLAGNESRDEWIANASNDNNQKLAARVIEPNRAASINDLVSYFHGKSTANGWWSEADKANPLVAPAKLMLIVSEIAEAMEGHRKGLQDDKLPHRKMIEVELGDALIRICDLAGHLGLDLGGATMEKDAYNDVRADHKFEARASVGGKAY